MTQKISKTESMMLATIRLHVRGWLSTEYTLEWCRPCLLTRILFPLIHLLLELLGFLIAYEGKACETVLKLKGVKESTILVVIEGVVDFLIPDHPSVGTLCNASQSFEYFRGAGCRRENLPICRPF